MPMNISRTPEYQRGYAAGAKQRGMRQRKAVIGWRDLARLLAGQNVVIDDVWIVPAEEMFRDAQREKSRKKA